MREIALDTETTGLSPTEGHRIVEIAAIELFNYVPTGKVYHQYINPERDMPEEAFRVHGLTAEFLSQHPTFDKIAEQFLCFIGPSPLVIHNADFDMRFLNAELVRLGHPLLMGDRAIDTLKMARLKYPGSRASLDALCKRFNIDNSGRVKHGALTDTELLAQVYLELRGGRQPNLGLGTKKNTSASGHSNWRQASERRKLALAQGAPTEEELAAHAAMVANLTDALWRK